MRRARTVIMTAYLAAVIALLAAGFYRDAFTLIGSFLVGYGLSKSEYYFARKEERPEPATCGCQHCN